MFDFGSCSDAFPALVLPSFRNSHIFIFSDIYFGKVRSGSILPCVCTPLTTEKQARGCSSVSVFWSHSEEFPTSRTFVFPPSPQRGHDVIPPPFHPFSRAHLCVGDAERPQPVDDTHIDGNIIAPQLINGTCGKVDYFQSWRSGVIGMKYDRLQPDAWLFRKWKTVVTFTLSLSGKISDPCRAVSGCV